MDHFQYLALLAGCVACTVPLEFFYGFKVWRDPKRLAGALAPGLVLFLFWDYFGVHRGNWGFDDDYLVGIYLPGGMPLEELLFFLIIPAASISGYEAVRASLGRRAVRSPGQEPGTDA